MTAIQKILVLFSATTILFSCNTKKSDTATLQQFNISQQKVWKENATVGSWQYNSGRLGFWGTDSSSLPVFHYTGKLPARTFRPDGREVNDKQDPIFLLGNYHLTLFAYASGKYQLMTLERSIASLNHDSINLGRGSFATLVLPDDTSKNKTHELLGLGSAAATDSNTEKAFGCGYAVYKYNLKGLKIRRTLATIPSQNIYDGCSAFLVNVEIENASDKDVTFSYAEGLTTSYEFMFRYNYPGLQIRASYPVTTRIDIAQNLAVADFNVKEKAAYAIGGRFDHTSAESYPQQVRLQLFPANDLNYQVVAVNKDSMRAELSGKVTGSIRKGAGTKFCYVIGYDNYANDNYWAASAQRLLKGVHQELPFRDEWKKEIGDFSYEKNDTIRNEMLWNQHDLLAMANWNEWYQDMFIPQ